MLAIETFQKCLDLLMETQENALDKLWQVDINMLVFNTLVNVGSETLSESMVRDLTESVT